MNHDYKIIITMIIIIIMIYYITSIVLAWWRDIHLIIMDFEFQVWYLTFTCSHDSNTCIPWFWQTPSVLSLLLLPVTYCSRNQPADIWAMHKSGLNKFCVLRSIILLCIWGLQYSTRAKNINYCVLHNYKQRPWNFAINMSHLFCWHLGIFVGWSDS